MSTSTTPSILSIVIDVPLQRIFDLLTCALEGGSSYWARITGYKTPPAFWRQPDTHHPIYNHLDSPLSHGGALLVEEKEVDQPISYTLNLDTIKQGLILMAHHQPRHFGNFISEKEDAETGDVFLQLALLGEVRYG